jgi:hypothetical protein
MIHQCRIWNIDIMSTCNHEVSTSSLPLTPRRERLHAFLADQSACQQPADDEAEEVDFLSTCEAIVGELVDPLHSALANIDELEHEFAEQQTSQEPNEDADLEKVGLCWGQTPQAGRTYLGAVTAGACFVSRRMC